MKREAVAILMILGLIIVTGYGLEYPADGLGPFATNWHNGSVVPDPALGFNGSYYLRDNGMVYHKSAGAWAFVTYINGTNGIQGPVGPPGIENMTANMTAGIALGDVLVVVNPLIAENETQAERKSAEMALANGTHYGADAISASSKNITQSMPLAGNLSTVAVSTPHGLVAFADALGHIFEDTGVLVSSLITPAASRLIADLQIIGNVTMILHAEELNRTSDYNQGILAHVLNDTKAQAAAVKISTDIVTRNISAEAINNTATQAAAVKTATDLLFENASLKVAGSSGGGTINASSIPRIMDGTGHAINGTNITILTGGTDGPNILNMGLGRITHLAAPVASTDAATRAYVDAAGGGGISLGTAMQAFNPRIAENETQAERKSAEMITANLTKAGNTSVPASSIQDGIVLFSDVFGHTFKDSVLTIVNVIASATNNAAIMDAWNLTQGITASTRNSSFAVDASGQNDTVMRTYINSNASKWASVTNRNFVWSNVTVLLKGTAATFTTNTSTRYLQIRLVGGGGGGGGVTGAATPAGAMGAGGGSGGYCEKWVTATGALALTYTVGVNGTGGSTAGGNGNPGTASTIAVSGTTYTGQGGSGGLGMTTGTSVIINIGGVGGAVSTNCDINAAGANGLFAWRTAGATGLSGSGGESQWGRSGLGRTHTGGAGTGNDAIGYGAGGGGALTISAVNRPGGGGAPGLIVIEEYSA